MVLGSYHIESSRARRARPALSLSLLLGLVLAGGCATTQSAVVTARSTEPVTVVAALVRDDVHSRATSAVPAELIQAVERDLAGRGIQVRVAGEAGYHESVAAVRSTPGRLAALAKEAGGAPLVLLIETRATFYSQLSGRYRWTVDARISLAPTADLGRASGADVQGPAFLFYDHQREDDAVAQLSRRISRQAGTLADDALTAGWPGLRGELLSIAAPSGPEAGTEQWRCPGARLMEWRAVPPPPGDAVYFAMVDRFARPGDSASVQAPADLHDFFGGTIGGLRERLDWLEELGVGTLWISPVYLSREKPFEGWGAFHGYWVEDHMSMWPRLGSFDDLRGLSGELGARDMRLLLDVVVNHVGYDAALVSERPDWFNDYGDIVDWSCPEQLVNHEVHGLPDLNQDDPEVYDYLIEHARLWIDEVRPDGFRLDAVKHVPLSFWRQFNAEVKAYAGQDFYLLGEDLEGDPALLSRTLHEGGFDALFDFPVHFALIDVFCRGAPLGRLASILSQDHLYGPGVGHRMVTFLDNHDLPRVISACEGDSGKVNEALTTLVALRGTPAITWGTEVGLGGAEEPANRAPMVFDDAHPMKRAVRAALRVRREHPELVSAETVLHRVEDEVMVLERLAETPVLLVVNRSEEPVEVELATADVELTHLVGGAAALNGATLAVPPRSVELISLRTPHGGSALGLAAGDENSGTTTAPGAPRVVEFTVRDAPGDALGRLRLVGAGEALGRWDVSRAVRFDGDIARLTLPSGLVAEYKLVLSDEDGARWEAGPNRHLLVSKGDEPLTVELTWRRES